MGHLGPSEGLGMRMSQASVGTCTGGRGEAERGSISMGLSPQDEELRLFQVAVSVTEEF